MRGNKLSNILFIKDQKGFSLIEMMVALGILSLIIIGLVTFFSGGTRAWVTGQYQLEAQRNARLSMDRMVKEIREGKNITSGSETSITVSVPHFDVDGDIDSYYSVTYALNDTTIQRDTNPLIENVLTGEAIFKYYNNSDTEVTSPDATVSKVHINLKVDVDKDDSSDITLNTDVNLRNYGLQE
ncbi:MAG: prepilin-type N-terminal cleavage/methylation domain-containing protein [Candidatus Atribacteria bacterium]|nr:prepilin-type N-terminal cleavage/methylation domain-containing protein [Candidatus Atribacteria bacterium]